MSDSIETMKRNKGMALLAALLSGAGFLMYAAPLAGLFRGAYRDDTFSYIVFIPLVSLYLLYEDRKRIFSADTGSLIPGVVLSSLGVLLFLAARNGTVGSSVPVERFALYALSAVLLSGRGPRGARRRRRDCGRRASPCSSCSS